MFTDENGHFEYTLTNERISYYRLLGYVSDVFIFSYDGIIAAPCYLKIVDPEMGINNVSAQPSETTMINDTLLNTSK